MPAKKITTTPTKKKIIPESPSSEEIKSSKKKSIVKSTKGKVDSSPKTAKKSVAKPGKKKEISSPKKPTKKEVDSSSEEVRKTTTKPGKKKEIPSPSKKPTKKEVDSSSEEVRKPTTKPSKKKEIPSPSKKPSKKEEITSPSEKTKKPTVKKPTSSPFESDSSSDESSDDEFRTKVIVVKKEIPFDEKSHLKDHLPNDLADLVTGYDRGLSGEVKTNRFENVRQIISLDGDILYILKYYGNFDNLDYRIFSKNLTSGEKKEIKLTPGPEEYVVTCSVSDGVSLLFGEYNSLLLYSMESGKLFCTVKNATEERFDLIKLISITRKNVTILLTLYHDYHDEFNTVLMIDMENQKVKSLNVDGEYLGARDDILYFVDGGNVITVQ